MRALITGGAGGLGLAVAAALAQQGWRVVIADRNVAAGQAAAAALGCEFRSLDLASLAAVRAFASENGTEPLDLLVNNAGILPSLERRLTADGYELAFGIAQLGHFALTGLLLPALRRAPASRVVSTTSVAHRWGRIDFDDLHATRSYESLRAYNQSKLAVMMFAIELDERARKAGVALQSLAAHPGAARTSIGNGRLAEPPRRLRDRLEMWAFRAAMACVGQTAAEGARPILHAATSTDARGGELFGPGGFQEWFGAPRRVEPSPKALDATARARLWDVSAQLTGVSWLM